MGDVQWRGHDSPCTDCRWLHWPESVMTCDAFPRGIPLEIRMGRHSHETKYPGDHGIRRRPLPPDVPAEGAVRLRAVLDAQGFLIGHLFWQDDAEGFLPTGDDFDAHQDWRTRVRRAQRGGATVQRFAEYLTTAPGEGVSYAIGPTVTKTAGPDGRIG